ncbi:hypothetical protein SAMN05192569_100739 [Parageobacillus thermantarcticus]|uniref:Uncharacterized protein n=1 Tax=Parageobacillus thermantarcticus TaxID=186116 RepID=A0A1I0SXE1_9BACL|nr:hypothetical protein SAMN05192569_100739 [Parageobacillus thermantarcticus]
MVLFLIGVNIKKFVMLTKQKEEENGKTRSSCFLSATVTALV